MIGVYKITNPKGKSYVGQSVDIKKRIATYKRLACKQQVLLYRSLLKYGFENHSIEILCECKPHELNEKEIRFIVLHKSFNLKTGLNLKAGGSQGGKCSEATKRKMRKPKSVEARENYRLAALRRPPVSEETREKHRKRMLGNKYLKGKKVWLNRNHSEETKEVIRQKRKLQVMPTGFKRPWTQEHRDIMSKRMSGEGNPSHVKNRAKRK